MLGGTFASALPGADRAWEAAAVMCEARPRATRAGEAMATNGCGL